MFSASGSNLTISNQHNTSFLIYIHIPKTGGNTFTRHLAELSDKYIGNTCYPYYQDPCCFSRVDTHNNWKEFGRRFNTSLCKVAASEWTYNDLKYIKLLDYEPKLLTWIRDPSALILSIIQWDIWLSSHQKNFHLASSVNETFEKIINNTDSGIPTRNTMSRWMLPVGMHLKDIETFIYKNYFFVGITEWHRHSYCVFNYKLGIFDPDTCTCSKLSNIEDEKLNKHADTAGILKSQINTLTSRSKRDYYIYSIGINMLMNDLKKIENEYPSVDLLSCFAPMDDSDYNLQKYLCYYFGNYSSPETTIMNGTFHPWHPCR